MYERYVRIKDGERKVAPFNDTDGSITGHIIIGVRQWFDENPEEAKRLGWTKMIDRTPKEAGVEYNPQTQFLMPYDQLQEDGSYIKCYHVADKTEEMMAMEELLEVIDNGYSTFTFMGGEG